MVSWQAFPSLLPSLRAPRVSLGPKSPFLSFSNARHAGYWQANILPNEAKYTLSYKFLFISFSSSHVKIDVCPGDDLQSFYPSEVDR